MPKVLDESLTAALHAKVQHPVSSPQPLVQCLVQEIRNDNLGYHQSAVSCLLSVPAALDLLQPVDSLYVAPQGILMIASKEDVEDVLNRLFSFSTDKNPMAGMHLSPNPILSCHGSKIQSNSHELFDSHMPVAAVSSPAANAKSMALFLENLPSQ